METSIIRACGIRISPESQLTSYKLIDSILLELSRKLKIQEQQKLQEYR